MNKPDDQVVHVDARDPAVLVILSIIGVGLSYAASIFIARWLGPGDYEHFAVSIASVSLFAAIAESGTGKYGLKALPGYRVSNEYALAAGYWRFSAMAVFGISMCMSLAVIIWESILAKRYGSYPLDVAVFFLPIMALAGMGIDLVMANRVPLIGMSIARIVIPGTTLLALLAVRQWLEHFTIPVAVFSYFAGSILGLFACGVVFWWTSPREFFTTKPEYRLREWLPECIYFATISFLSLWTMKISLIVLEMLPIEEAEIASFAAAMETGCLVLLLAKSTDKLFQPEISVILTRRSWEAGATLRRNRFLLVGTSCILFVLTMVLFGRRILGLYGPAFEAGYPALLCISVGTSMATVFSLAPIFLRFVGYSKYVIGVIIGSAIAVAVLTPLLALPFGATGAGVAFGVVLSTTAWIYFACANRVAGKLQESEPSDEALS